MRLFRDMRLLTGLLLSVLLSSPGWAEEAGGDKGGLPQFDTSLFPEQLFWLAVSFAFLYLMMSLVALPRVARTQTNRKTLIAAELEAARAANDTAKVAVASVEKSLSEARAKAQVSVSDMMAEVMQQANERQAAQEKEQQRHLHRAEADIAVTREAALKAIGANAADLAGLVVEKILNSKGRVSA